MARNWNSGQQTGLSQIIDAYNQGADRNRAIAKEKADSQKQGSEWAYVNTQNVRKPTTNEYGHVTGYETNADTRKRNTPILQKDPRTGGLFQDRQPPAAPAPTVEQKQAQPAPAPMAEEDPIKAKHRAYNRARGVDPSRDPQSESAITPLLKDPSLKHQDAQLAHDGEQAEMERGSATEMESARLASGERQGDKKLQATAKAQAMKLQPKPGERARTAMVPEGTKAFTPSSQKLRNPETGIDEASFSNLKLERTDDLEVPPNPVEEYPQNVKQQPGVTSEDIAPPPADPAEYDPDDYLFGQATKMLTTTPPRASEQMVSVGTLPPALLAGTGLEGFKGQIPATILKDVLSGKTKIDLERLKQLNGQGAGGKNLPPEALPFIGKVERGEMDSADGIAAYSQAHPDKPLTPDTVRAFTTHKGMDFRKRGQDAAEKARQETQKRLVSKALGTTVKTTTKQWREANISLLEETNYAEKAKQMANSGNTKGMVGAIRNMLARASSEKGPLSVYDVQQFGGVEGWAERAEQWLNSGANDGLTAENIAIVNRLSDIYIKAAHEKAKFKAKPLLGELRANVRAEFGEESADLAAKLMEEEMNLTIEYGNSGAKDTAPLRDKDGKPVKALVPAKPGGDDLEAAYKRTVDAINAKGYNPSQKRVVLEQARKAYEAKKGK